MVVILAIALFVASIKTFGQWLYYPDFNTALFMGRWDRQQWLVFDLLEDKWAILGTTFGVWFFLTFAVLAFGWWAINHR
jgi:hypothetical protein